MMFRMIFACLVAIALAMSSGLMRTRMKPNVKGQSSVKSAASRYSERINKLHSESENGDSGSSSKAPGDSNFWKGLAQLVTMGAGAPSLGEFKEIDESGKAIFELEANNFLKETDGKFFEQGYVEGSEDDIQAPGFFENLLSGGKAMRDWEVKRTEGGK